MNTERLFNAVLIDYSSEQLRLEDKLETVINSKMDIDDKINQIKSLLAEITTNEASILKFKSMVSIPNNNGPVEGSDKQINNEENGQI
jgi:uncharacterized protein YutD